MCRVRKVHEKMTTLADTYFNHVHPLAFALSDAQQHGVLIDKVARAELVDVYKKKIEETKAKISTLVGRELNPNSPKQVKELLYDQMHLPTIFKKGKPTTEEEALLKLHNRYPDELILNAIITYRKDTKLVSTFLGEKEDADGRMRTSYNPSGTKNFRISSSENLWGSGMNLQNIPVGKRPGVVSIRHLFIASPGCSFVRGDLKQADIMVVARILCRFGDYTLWNKYANDPDFDVHRWAAADILGIPESEVTVSQRAGIGRCGNHGGNYCAGPKVILSLALKYGVDGIDYQMAKRIIDTRRKSLPGLVKWWRWVETTIRRTRTLTTCLGRRRQFFGRFDDHATIRDAVAFEPQSIASGDVCNTIFRLMHAAFTEDPDCWPNCVAVLQVHDEVVVECPDALVDDVRQLMQKASIVPLNLNKDMIPLVIPIEITVGKNWRDCK